MYESAFSIFLGCDHLITLTHYKKYKQTLALQERDQDI